MRSAVWSLVLLVACGGDDAGPAGDIAATVTHYDYTFDVMTREAHAKVTAKVDTAGDCLTLPFRATAFDPATAKVDGKPAVSAQANDTSMLVCGAGHKAGSTITIEADQ